jgi:hypothetical protein
LLIVMDGFQPHNFDPEFARDSRSVRLGLSMDGFQPHSDANSLYSC